ncbi:AAEL017328-PA [Aedes aegypti]|uniref:AAEL017328-PA n=1 Tax=Aedes aegypti TaxID=7159 RepID=J9HHI3_AEDAE|nr:AAEL017328-PA [Aedes aegypti]
MLEVNGYCTYHKAKKNNENETGNAYNKHPQKYLFGFKLSKQLTSQTRKEQFPSLQFEIKKNTFPFNSSLLQTPL